MIRRNIEPHLIISSPFQRAVKTARPTQEHYNLDVLPYDITRETGLLRSGKSSSVLYIHNRIQEFSYLNDQAYEGTSREERIRAKQEYFRIGDPDYIDGRVGKDGEILGTFAESFNQACRDVYLFARILLDIESKMREARLLSEDEELTVLAFSHEQRMDIVRLLATYPEAMQQLKNNPAIVLSKEMGEKLLKEFYRIAIDLPPDKKPESPIPNGHIIAAPCKFTAVYPALPLWLLRNSVKVVAVCCSSPSIKRTSPPRSALAMAILRARVVLPTPPLVFPTVKIIACVLLSYEYESAPYPIAKRYTTEIAMAVRRVQ